MGTDRGRNKNRQAEKVRKSLTEEFGLKIKDVYTTWLAYLRCVSEGMNNKEALLALHSSLDVKEEMINYFAVIGLNAMTNAVERGI